MSLFNVLSQKPHIYKNYLYVKDLFESKCQFLISKRESTGSNLLNNYKANIEYSNDMDNIYKNIEEYNPNKKRKILIIFDDTIADILSNRKPNAVVTKLSIRGRKLIFLYQRILD